MMIKDIYSLLELHEGTRIKPYDDTTGNEITLPTNGKITIGVGFNLTDVGLLPEEIDFILRNRVEKTEIELERAFPWFNELDEVRKAVLIDMGYNMGIITLKSFRNTLAMVKEGDYVGASRNMLKSLWARQVKGRAKRLARMMETGQWPAF